jgi:hypothetical protein
MAISMASLMAGRKNVQSSHCKMRAKKFVTQQKSEIMWNHTIKKCSEQNKTEGLN